jgi:hypothetical protein
MGSNVGGQQMAHRPKSTDAVGTARRWANAHLSNGKCSRTTSRYIRPRVPFPRNETKIWGPVEQECAKHLVGRSGRCFVRPKADVRNGLFKRLRKCEDYSTM